MTKKNIQPVHNESVVQGIASEFWEKDTKWENSLHTCPNGCTICSLCKVGATVPMEEKTYIYKKESDVMLAMWNDFIRKMWWKLSKSFIDKFIERWWKPTRERLNNVIDS